MFLQGVPGHVPAPAGSENGPVRHARGRGHIWPRPVQGDVEGHGQGDLCGGGDNVLSEVGFS